MKVNFSIDIFPYYFKQLINLLSSDRGSQYTSQDFQGLLAFYGMITSMSGTGNCFDNATAESFFHTLKTEHVYFENYQTSEQAKESIFEIDAVGRRNQVRILIDGITAANDLGLTNAVPGQIIVHTDGRIQPIQLGNLIIKFTLTAPSKLYWAERPAMHIVQALYWLHGSLKNDEQMTQEIKTKLIRFLRDSKQGSQICKDLQTGLHTVPLWMREWIQELLIKI